MTREKRSSGERHWRRAEADLLEQNKTSKSRQERELGRGREKEREER